MGESSAGGSLTVPEGYQIAVARQAAAPSFSKVRSGIVIADFGPQAYLAEGFVSIENQIRQDPATAVVWVLQKAAMDYWTADAIRMAVLLRRFYRVRQVRLAAGGVDKAKSFLWLPPGTSLSEALTPDPLVQPGTMADTVYVSDTGPVAWVLMAMLNWLGIPVSVPGPDGEVLVEVHRPDNAMILGLPGQRPAAPPADLTLAKNYDERARLEQSPGSEAALQALEQAELAYIDQVVRNSTRATDQLPGEVWHAAEHPLLSRMMAGMTPQAMPAFISAFRATQVGISADAVAPGARVASTTHPDGLERLLVCADPALFQMRYDASFNGVTDGVGAFNIVQANPGLDGIYVNSALATSGVIISREEALAALSA